MRLDQLTDAQRAERQTMIDTLTAAGWKPTDVHEYVEQGGWHEYEASLAYRNDSATLMLEMNAEQATYEFTMTTRGKELPLLLHPHDELAPLLEFLIAEQDTLDGDTFRAFAERLLAVCPEVYVDREDGEPERLHPAS